MSSINEIEALEQMTQLLIQFVQTSAMQELKQQNYIKYEKYLEEVFPTLAESYPYLFMTILKGENKMEFINVMFDNMKLLAGNVETQANIEKKLGEDLANKYLYPSLPDHIRKKIKK
jgi:hypothetical protein